MPQRIRDATRVDFGRILALNLESEHFLSPMDGERLRYLDGHAAYHRVVVVDGEVVAFLLALREGLGYDSANYRWFAERYGSFLYVDRVVVARSHQGERLGAALYDDLFAYAKDCGISPIACEFDVEPANEASRRFHTRYGFREVGTQWLAGGAKRVSLQVMEVGPVPA